MFNKKCVQLFQKYNKLGIRDNAFLKVIISAIYIHIERQRFYYNIVVQTLCKAIFHRK